MGKGKTVKIICLVGVGILVLAIVLFCVMTAVKNYASWYTEEEHLQRIAERVEKRYFSENSEYGYTDYEVFPVYNENDEFKYALVEFKPQGFVYIQINEYSFPLLPGSKSMYVLGANANSSWKRFVSIKVGENGWDKEYVKDENGEEVEYHESHFKVAGITGEKRYLIYGTPAVKRGDKFLNLISNETGEKETMIGYPAVFFEFAGTYNL